MSTLIDNPTLSSYSNGHIFVTMSSGFKFDFPCSDYPRLASASSEKLKNMELSPLGIHWPDIDEDLSIRGLLRDHGNS
ncbi:MAG: DUF2442 domain-containing protein [Verrucomicrobiota bacterium]